MTTSTLQIQQDLDRTLEGIRSNRGLSEEAKRRYITEAYEKAQADYRAAVETQEQEIQERSQKAEKALFEIPHRYAADDLEKAQHPPRTRHVTLRRCVTRPRPSRLCHRR